MKELLRVLAVDDGYFKPRKKGKTILVGVISRLDGRIEGILSTKIDVDGTDCTAKIIRMLKESKFEKQAQFVLLAGLNSAGFNMVDLPKLNKALGIPCIVAMRKMPRMDKIEAALSRFKDKKKRMGLIEKAGKIFAGKNVFFQFAGTDEKTARAILRKTRKHSNMPEPLRLAHLIASGITLGESTRP